jgi:hypothetical protein
MQTSLQSVILLSACNYTYLQNFMTLKLLCLIKLLYFSVHFRNKWYLITFGKHNFEKYFATSKKCLNQLQYAHLLFTNCGTNSILLLLLVLDEIWYDHFTDCKVTNILQSVRKNTSWWTDRRSAGQNFKIHSKDQICLSASQEASNATFQCHFSICKYPLLGTFYVVLTSVKFVLL